MVVGRLTTPVSNPSRLTLPIPDFPPTAERRRPICLLSIEAPLLLLLLLSLNLLLLSAATKRTMLRHRSACGLHEPGPPFLFHIWKQQIDPGSWVAATFRGSRPGAPWPSSPSSRTCLVVRVLAVSPPGSPLSWTRPIDRGSSPVAPRPRSPLSWTLLVDRGSSPVASRPGSPLSWTRPAVRGVASWIRSSGRGLRSVAKSPVSMLFWISLDTRGSSLAVHPRS